MTDLTRVFLHRMKKPLFIAKVMPNLENMHIKFRKCYRLTLNLLKLSIRELKNI